jgi:8-oxo-dGTP pyrophosphatase MutT (NUDIX family)
VTRPLLDLDPGRAPVTPVDAATLVLVRDGAAGVEVFCVERSVESRFMGGAVVFPGGRVEPDDHDPAWRDVTGAPSTRAAALGERTLGLALTIAACRESLEEAAILPVDRVLTHEDVLTLRDTLAGSAGALRQALRDAGLHINLQQLVPFARWVTPAAERRRFDARFFMVRAPEGQPGAPDAHETTRSFWVRPGDLLQRWEAGELQLAPPTHHTLWSLTCAHSVDEALAAAAARPLAPIHPHLIDVDGTRALALPGDPAHPSAAALLDGPSRYVLRGERWTPEGWRDGEAAE